MSRSASMPVFIPPNSWYDQLNAPTLNNPPTQATGSQPSNRQVYNRIKNYEDLLTEFSHLSPDDPIVHHLKKMVVKFPDSKFWDIAIAMTNCIDFTNPQNSNYRRLNSIVTEVLISTLTTVYGDDDGAISTKILHDMKNTLHWITNFQHVFEKMPIVELLELINSELLKSFRTIYGFHNALVEHMQPEAFFQYTILTATIKVFQILRWRECNNAEGRI